MKKILVLFVSVLIIVGCSNKITGYQEITFSDLNKKFEDEENFVLFIGSNQCSHCMSYEPKLNAVIKVNQLKVYYIDVANLSEDENKILDSYVPYTGTPTTVFIEKGKLKEIDNEVYMIEGDRDIEYIEKMFKKNGYI